MVRQAFVLRVAALCWVHDPIALAAIGAPTDEYTSEARTIVERVPEARDADDLARIVAEEFAHWFTPEIAGPRRTIATWGARSGTWSTRMPTPEGSDA